jgi:[FeFe] hydrogenase H-cluster maturation GTPase HydF
MPASLNSTPSSERVHIGLFGCRNAGKSSLINAITGQDLAIVSDYKGTTTDPVSKAMEILPLGPVLLTDTPGMDDDSDLGQSRIEKARLVLRSTDIALLVVDAQAGLSPFDEKLLTEIRDRKIPYLVVFNKGDLVPGFVPPKDVADHAMVVSAAKNTNIWELKERLSKALGKDKQKPILNDLLEPNALVVLVVPCDESAPKGRLILPQQQVIRELLDFHHKAIVVQPQELPSVIDLLGTKISLVVTDSQAFHIVNQMVPPEIRLTSFSILFARYKGQLGPYLEGAAELKRLKDGDKGADFRRVHPSPPVQRHRHREAAQLDPEVLRGPARLQHQQRQRVPRRPDPVQAGGPLRRLHAERPGSGLPPAVRP